MIYCYHKPLNSGRTSETQEHSRRAIAHEAAAGTEEDPRSSPTGSCDGRTVGNVDFKRVREIFVEDAVAFGSKVEMVTSRDALEQEQWRPIWPTMADYRYDLSTLEVIVSPTG